MLSKILISLTQQMNDYLKLHFRLKEDIAFLSPPKDNTNAFPSNRISLFIINIEKENAGGLNFNQQSISDSGSRKTAPSWNVNIYLLISAVFLEKQYKESLQIMSGVLSFIQRNNLFSIPGRNSSIAIEPVTLSFHELSNIWSIFGGSYYPSILCKLRAITIDEGEILDMSTSIGQQSIESGIK
jgi:hypothetical protein